MKCAWRLQVATLLSLWRILFLCESWLLYFPSSWGPGFSYTSLFLSLTSGLCEIKQFITENLSSDYYTKYKHGDAIQCKLINSKLLWTWLIFWCLSDNFKSLSKHFVLCFKNILIHSETIFWFINTTLQLEEPGKSFRWLKLEQFKQQNK